MRKFVFAVLAWLSIPLAQAQLVWPPGDPDAWVLAHVDVETTGLDPAYHEMIDIGMIYTDLEGRELGRLHLRILPAHPGRLDEGARRVNGFDAAAWVAGGALSEAEAVRRIVEFHEHNRAGKRVLFTAYNAWFDQAFTSALFARHGAAWREFYFYHVLDLPSMAWGQGLRALNATELAAALGLPDETRVPSEHTGITGAAFNLAVYRALLARQGGTAR